MNANDLVRGLIKSTLHRAIRESAACLIVLIVFTLILRSIPVGTLGYYGCLLILVATGFIVGIVWSFALSYKLLHAHPASDSAFWREAFHAQARLLRLVPLWYLAPLCSGMILMCAPTTSEMVLPFLMLLPIPLAVLAATTWLNRRVAVQLEAQAARLES